MKAQCRMIYLLLSNETFLSKWIARVPKAFLPLRLLRCTLYTCMRSDLSINVGYLKNLCKRYIICVYLLLNYLFYSLSRNGIIHYNDTCICSWFFVDIGHMVLITISRKRKHAERNSIANLHCLLRIPRGYWKITAI